MPLDRTHITLASRVMVLVYPPFCVGVGLSFTLTPRHRLLDSPSLRYLDTLAPLPVWGWGFLILAVLLAVALATRRRVLYVYALGAMVVWMATYAVATASAAFHGGASFSAWQWPAFIACACWATMLSLQAREK